MHGETVKFESEKMFVHPCRRHRLAPRVRTSLDYKNKFICHPVLLSEHLSLAIVSTKHRSPRPAVEPSDGVDTKSRENVARATPLDFHSLG